MKKQQYEEPKIMITRIKEKDVITASGDDDIHSNESDMILFGNDNE